MTSSALFVKPIRSYLANIHEFLLLIIVCPIVGLSE